MYDGVAVVYIPGTLLLFIIPPLRLADSIKDDCGGESVDSCSGLYMADDDDGEDAADVEGKADNGITDDVLLLLFVLILLLLLFMINAGLS